MGGVWGRLRLLAKHSDAVVAFGVIGLVLLLIVPLPPVILDALICINIVLSVMALLLTIYVENALELSAFPSVLLFLTLFRLGLNIASTRMILIRSEAGDIIQTFGHFVIQGNEVVGLILFVLLTVINFIVVTKGAGRIAEVAARFTLEALAGKQMAIDSELNAGLITQSQAKEERGKIGAEADFYGAMDGASKFVKGDAVAGILIILVNLLGGIIIGIGIKGMSWLMCWKTVSRLTIGDGLVSQVPALLVSVGAAMMVTRTANGSLGKTIPQQIFHHPKVLFITGALLIMISWIPGMPSKVIIPISGCLLAAGYFQHKQKNLKDPSQIKPAVGPLLLAHPIEIQLGYQVVSLAKILQEKLVEMREKITLAYGFRLPAVHISDQLELPPTGWAILIKGVKVASGRDAEIRLLTQELLHTIEKHAHTIINRQDVFQILQEVTKQNNAVVEELYPKKLSLGQILKVLQQLLKERIPIRDSVTILEILADHAEGEKSDLDLLTEEVRQALSAKISEKMFGKTRKAFVISLDPKIEQMITAAKGTLRPKTVDQIALEIIQIHDRAKSQGIQPVLITARSTRLPLKRMIEKKLPELAVLSYPEVNPEIELTNIGMIANEVLL
jgi:flagellar biosynthesis protein FlhA